LKTSGLCAIIVVWFIGPLAQVVEQLAFNQRVAGSSPARLIPFNSINYQADSVSPQRVLDLPAFRQESTI
jgi:hypothetical protein